MNYNYSALKTEDLPILSCLVIFNLQEKHHYFSLQEIVIELNPGGDKVIFIFFC